jgi:hypothetical protein
MVANLSSGLAHVTSLQVRTFLVGNGWMHSFSRVFFAFLPLPSQPYHSKYHLTVEDDMTICRTGL